MRDGDNRDDKKNQPPPEDPKDKIPPDPESDLRSEKPRRKTPIEKLIDKLKGDF